MSCTNVHLTIANGLSDPQTLVLGYMKSGSVSAFDFSTADRVVLQFFQDGTQQESLDSDIAGEADAIDYDNGDGELVLDIGPQDIPKGDYKVRVIVYNPEYPSGRILNRGDGYTFDLTITD